MPFYNNDRADDWDYFDRHSIGTQYKFILWPRRCHISGKFIWLKYAYVKTAMYTGPGEPIFEHRFYDKQEFLVNRLKGLA